ncbi:DNA repair photolyase [Parelusimicrobium proximum]|uniref:SPL family radical SAM protein n=1 Tax=Parelusimicrobium proximum TaxID=3228953 RepID=UPI003D179BCD
MEYTEAKTIVTKSNGAEHWFGMDYNMNIYRGCSHGCIYCDSRSEVYGIEDFDRVRAKKDALSIIERELSKKRKKGIVATGSMSDPYNPCEEKELLTRGALELLNKYGFGLALATKSAMVERDIDVLKKIASHSPVIIKITITSASDELSRKIEPRVSLSSERFAAIKKLTDNGIFVGILMMPLLPFIEDTEENVAGIVKQAAEAGAKFIFPSFGVTMRQKQREYFLEKAEAVFAGMKEKYIKTFGNEYSCASPRQRQLWQLFRREAEKYGILYKMPDIIKAYKDGYGDKQLDLF